MRFMGGLWMSAAVDQSVFFVLAELVTILSYSTNEH
jgi:hypothetical protein